MTPDDGAAAGIAGSTHYPPAGSLSFPDSPSPLWDSAAQSVCAPENAGSPGFSPSLVLRASAGIKPQPYTMLASDGQTPISCCMWSPADGNRIHARVVIAEGLGAPYVAYRFWAPLLALNGCVVDIMDWRDQGYSGGPGRKDNKMLTTLDEHHDDFALFVDRVAGKRQRQAHNLVVMACSMGAKVATLAMKRGTLHPDYFFAMAPLHKARRLPDSPLGYSKRLLARIVGGELASKFDPADYTASNAECERVLRAIEGDPRLFPPRVGWRWIESHDKATRELESLEQGAIKVPGGIFLAENDKVVDNQANEDFYKRAMPECSITRIPDTRHALEIGGHTVRRKVFEVMARVIPDFPETTKSWFRNNRQPAPATGPVPFF